MSLIDRYRRSQLAKNAGWMVAGQGASFVFQAAYFVVLARLLGPAQYGIYAGAFAFVSIVAQYSTVGSGTVFLRYVSPEPHLFAVYWGNILVVTFSVASLMVIVLTVAAPHLIDPASATLVLAASIAICFCSQLLGATAQVFQAFEQMRYTALLSILLNLIRFVAAGLMLLVLKHATALEWTLASLFTSCSVAAMAIAMVTVKFGFPRFDFRVTVRRGSEGFQYAFATSTASAYNDLDKAMLSHYGMNAANGIYSMAYRVIDIATIPIVSLRDAAMPSFFREGRQSVVKAKSLAFRLLAHSLVISVAASAICFLAAPLIPLLTGKGFGESTLALRWLCLLPVLRCVHQFTGTALTGSGLQRYRTATQVAAAAINYGLCIWLIPVYSWRGAAWASLVTDGALALANYFTLSFVCRGAILKESVASRSSLVN